MTEELDAIDVMTYERKVVEFLGEDRTEKCLKNYRQKQEQPIRSNKLNPAPNPGRQEPDPILSMLYDVRKTFDLYWQTGELALNDQIVNIAIIGRYLLSLENTRMVDPSGNDLETSMADIYQPRLWNEKNFWDAFFELEMASILHRNDFSTKLIHEGDQGGSDIYLDGFDAPVWVECKRKRDLVPEEEDWNLFKDQLMNNVWDGLNIGTDSFVIRIQSDSKLHEEHLDTLANEIAGLVNNLNSQRQIEIADDIIEIELIDYYSGDRTIDFDPQEGGSLELFNDNAINDNMEILSQQTQPRPIGQLFAHDLYSHLDYDANPNSESGTASASVEYTEDRNLEIKNAYVVEYDVPNEVDYARGVMSTINSSTSNLSRKSPATAFIHIPIGRWNALVDNYTTYNGEKVTQRKRVEISIKGILKDNPNINAVVLTSRRLNRSGKGVASSRFGVPYLNKYPEEPIAKKFEKFLTKSFSTGV